MEEKKIPDIWDVNFINFINGLGLECLMALGKLENPVTKKKESDLRQARYVIDTLDMLREKTKGNLAEDEQKILDEMLVYLKMLFVEVNQEGKDTGND
ncbi:MAG TPA: DUF1844 domain-containing protein [Candidatus Omnitrophica bacterium]|nr:DUF1844 domain-containing protein [Candidatus Omnitrophota bacterium]